MQGSGRSFAGWMVVLAFGAYAVLFYAAVLFADRVYVFRDLVTFFYTLEHEARLLADFGWPPQWNPFAVLGKPFAADPLAGVYYAPNWILRQLPVALGFNLSLVLHHAWAAAGMYFVARRLSLSLAAAVLAGLLYGFGGPLVSCDNLYSGLLTAAWAPWVILAFLHWRQRPSIARLVPLAVALSLSLLGSLPEFTLFTLVLLACVALDGGGSEVGVARWRAFAAIALAGALAAGLCAVQWLPSAEYIGQSSRAAGLNVVNALENSLPPAGLLSFLVPRGSGDLDGAPWLLTLYFGPALALALLAPALLPRGRRWWIAVPILFLCLSFGEHLPGYVTMIQRFAWLRVVRYPEKFLFGLHALLALAAGAGLEVVLRRGQGFALPLGAAVVLLTAADLYRANAGLLPAAPWSAVQAAPSSTRIMEVGDDPLRIYGNAAGIPALPPYPQGLQLEKDVMLFQTASLYQIANLNAPSTINLNDHEELEQLLETVPHERVAALLGAFNAAYVTSARPLERPDLSLVRAPSTPLQAYVYRVEPLVPRVFVPRRARAAATAAEALAWLRDGGPPGDEVVLEGVSHLDSGAVLEGRATLVRYQPDRVDVHATMTTPGFVVLSDTFAPGWRVEEGGEERVILRANRFARAVAVSAGEHDLVFHYSPASYRLGRNISLAVAAAMGLALAVSLLRQRRRAGG